MLSHIHVNTIIEWLTLEGQQGELIRILYLDPVGDHAVVFPLPGDKDMPQIMELSEIIEALESGKAFVKPFDPYAASKDRDDELKPSHIQRRDKAWSLIKALALDEPAIFNREGRGLLVSEASTKLSSQPKYIYMYLRKFWAGGKVKNALLPNYSACGGRGKNKGCSEKKRGRPMTYSTNAEDLGVNVTELDRGIFRMAIDKFYDTKDEASVRRTYDLMLGEFYNRGFEENKGRLVPILPPIEERITIGQFRYWFKKILNFKSSVIARKGQRTFNLQHREVLKDSTLDSSGPGHIFQIDATIADVYVVSSLQRKRIIGRPVLYFVIDVFSRLIVGFYVGLEGPNYMGAAMALANTALNKVELCSRYGISIEREEWPVEVLCQNLVADKAELLSNASDYLADAFNMNIKNTPAYRADFKGIVEQQFNRANVELIHWLPGAVKERLRERGEKDHRLDATLTLDEFTKLIIYMILNHNQGHFFDEYPLLPEMAADGVRPIPVELWQWGQQNCTGLLRHYSKQEVIKGLMKTGYASITSRGIKFQNLFYSCEKAEEEEWFVKARNFGAWKEKVFFDPRNMNRIFLLPDQRGDLQECHPLEKSQRFLGHGLEDILEFFHDQKVNKRSHNSNEQQGNAELNSHIQGEIDLAKEKTDAAWGVESDSSDNKKLLSIRENRKMERTARGIKEAFNPIEVDSPGVEGSVNEVGGEGSESIVLDESVEGLFSSQRENVLDMLRKQRE